MKTSNLVGFGFALSVLAMVLWVFGVIPWFIGYVILAGSIGGFIYGSRQSHSPDSGWVWIGVLMIGILASVIGIVIGVTGLIFPFANWPILWKALYLVVIAGVIGAYIYFQR